MKELYQKAGRVGVAALDGAAHLPHRPVRRVAALGQVPGPGGVDVVAHGVGEFLSRVPLVAQEALVVVVAAAQVVATLLAQDDLVEADAVPLRIDVQLAHGVGLVAVVAEHLRHGGQVRVHGPVLVEDAVPVSPGRGPRHQGPPRRDAGRRGRVGLGEEGAVGGQMVEGRREDALVARGAQQRAGPVVDTDEQDVGLRQVAAPLPTPAKPSRRRSRRCRRGSRR